VSSRLIESRNPRPGGRQSTFQVKLVAQPIGNGVYHLATIRVVLQPVTWNATLSCK
jgi:hypothetical protein